MISPVVYPPTLMIGASSYRQRLTLTYGYCAEALPPAWAEDLLDAMVAELPLQTSASGLNTD